MLRYAVIFFIIAIVAGSFGFTSIAVGAAAIAKLLLFIFIVLFLITLILGAKIRANKSTFTYDSLSRQY